MALAFPNESRAYDATRQAVRFWGHDSALECSFFVTAEALKLMRPAMAEGEAAMLAAFDACRDRIFAVAKKLYTRGSKGSYELRAADM